MQVNQGFDGLRSVNFHPPLLPPRPSRQTIDSNAPPSSDVQATFHPSEQGAPAPQSPSFGNLLSSVQGPLPPTLKPPVAGASLLGAPPHVDQLATRVRDYRDTLSAVNSDLLSQLKSAKDVLQEARKSGVQDLITAAQTAVDDLNVQIKANQDSLSQVRGDVKGLRELSQQLIADVKAGNLDALQQDRNAITQQRDKVLADLQA